MIEITGITTLEALATAVAKAVRTQKWHFFAGIIQGKQVRLKAYGLYLQIFEVEGIKHGQSHYQTQRQMKEDIKNAIK